MELQTSIKELSRYTLSDEEYQKQFSVILNPAVSKKRRGRAAMRVACSCYLAIAKLVFAFKSSELDLDELLSFGLQALAEIILEARHYNPANGHIMPYVKLGLKGRMAEYVRNNRADRTPYKLAGKPAADVKRVQAAMRAHRDESGEWPNAEQILDRVRRNEDKRSKSMSLEQVEKCLSIIRDKNVVEINAPLNNGGTFADLISDNRPHAEAQRIREEDDYEERYQRLLVTIDLALDKIKLNERSMHILKARLGYTSPSGQQELSEEYGISRQRVQQIEAHGLKQISETTGLPIEQIKAVAELARARASASQTERCAA